MTVPSGLVIVDKPAGLTSHDVVARIRRLAGTRRVGHAGTLDPMATGVLVVGVEQATRLLGHLTLTQKEYRGTVRLGQRTSTDDAEGEILDGRPADGITPDALAAAAAALTGEIQQVPPGISAIKVGGQRAYRLTREGRPPDLPPRPVTVFALDIVAVRRTGAAAGDATEPSEPGAQGAPSEQGEPGAEGAQAGLLDVDIAVTCSSGTYIRALARDLGAALGVGGHLTALRRTRVGPYRVSDAATLDELAGLLRLIPLAQAAAAAFTRRDLTAAEARLVGHGGRLPAEPAAAEPTTGEPATGPVAAFAPDGSLVALLAAEDGQARPLAVFASQAAPPG